MTTTKSYLPECNTLEVRTHCPTPTVRIVRPSGPLTQASAAALTSMLKVCLHEGHEDHLVLDLRDAIVGRDADDVLAELDTEVRRSGRALHVTGAGVRGADDLSTDEIVARIALAQRCRAPRRSCPG